MNKKEIRKEIKIINELLNDEELEKGGFIEEKEKST